MQIKIPELALVVLIGPSGAGKSTFALKHFMTTEIVSSDRCRAIISDNENDQSVSAQAFALVHTIIRKRLELGRLTVVDATSIQSQARKPLLAIARRYNIPAVAIVFDLPETICLKRDRMRSDRNVGIKVIHLQRNAMDRSIKELKREGFDSIYTIDSEAKAKVASVQRIALRNNKKDSCGPFDIIGDIHGCCRELELLLNKLGYQRVEKNSEKSVWGNLCYHHPYGRMAVFLGDIVDRGPRVLDSLRLVRNMVTSKSALCVAGNHDIKFLKKLKGRNVQISHGLEKTMAEYDALEEKIKESFGRQAIVFLLSLPSHYVLDAGKLVVAHAGMLEHMQGRQSNRVRRFALYGDVSGKTDENGLPIRRNWAVNYSGVATVVYGHTPIHRPKWLNGTVNIDTGCVFGGKLTAMRYPEKEFVMVPADKIYAGPSKPFLPNSSEYQK